MWNLIVGPKPYHKDQQRKMKWSNMEDEKSVTNIKEEEMINVFTHLRICFK